MVTPIPITPARSVEQVLCDLSDSVANLNALLMALANGTLRLSVLTAAAPTDRFNVAGAIGIGIKPQQILPRNPQREAFSLQWANPGTVYISDGSFDPAQTAAMQSLGIDMSGHIGEVWAASTAGTLNVIVIEQFRGAAPSNNDAGVHVGAAGQVIIPGRW